MFDLIVADGTVIDGTGAPRRRADVGVIGNRIAAIGDLATADARTRVPANGLVVAPGWVDLHSHSDVSLLSAPGAPSKFGDGSASDAGSSSDSVFSSAESFSSATTVPIVMAVDATSTIAAARTMRFLLLIELCRSPAPR